MSPITIGNRPDPGFDRPLDLLSACHRRIENFLGIFGKVLDGGPDAPLDDIRAEGLLLALHYFRTAAPLHTADEEESLFPRLRKIDLPEVAEALSRVEELEQDHQTADLLLGEVGRIVGDWLEATTLKEQKATRLRAVLTELGGRYASHIRFEDEVLFPLAARVLPEPALKEMGREMMERR